LLSKTRRERIYENEDNNNSVMIRQKKRWITYFYSKINVFDKKTKSKKSQNDKRLHDDNAKGNKQNSVIVRTSDIQKSARSPL
jgi:ABC-type Fe3+/spermidine/putrescine transport system ATPase subunit